MAFRRILQNYSVQLSLILALTFLIQLFLASAETGDNYFILQVPLDENIWTIFTSVFAHVNLNHLLSNILGLLIFGLPVAVKSSRLKFYLFFVLTGVIAGIAQVIITGYMFDANGGVVGASGAIFALLGYLITSNRVSRTSLKFFPIPRIIKYLIYGVIALWITLATASPQTAIFAHFVGLFLGLIAGRNNLLRTDSD